jgi:hypothetical protein
MSTKRVLTILGFCCLIAGWAFAQSAADHAKLRSEFRAEVKAMSAGHVVTALSPAPRPGGDDPDSFGRNVVFDGLEQSGYVSLQSDCTPAPGDPPLGPNDRCVVLNPAPAATSFDLPDIGQLTIPGKSAHSVLCHWLTPIAYYTFENPTGTFQPNAIFRLSPYVVVESEVLNDPSLIDPMTGLPFAGQLTTSFAATYWDSQSLDVNQMVSRYFSESRVCIAGFLSKAGLMGNYGLTEVQAKAVFSHDMTLHFGLRGNAQLVGYGQVTYGLRVVGD